MKSVSEFRENLKLNSVLLIKSKKFQIKQIVKFRLSDGDIYDKLFLDNNWALADDSENNQFLFVREIKTNLPIEEKSLAYNNQTFEFLYSANHVIAEEVCGEGPFQVGDTESFSDYQSD